MVHLWLQSLSGNESNTQLSFTAKEGKPDEYSVNVNGKGMNQFGLFEISGLATKRAENDTYKLRLRKRYITSYKSPDGDSEVDDDDTSSMYED